VGAGSREGPRRTRVRGAIPFAGRHPDTGKVAGPGRSGRIGEGWISALLRRTAARVRENQAVER